MTVVNFKPESDDSQDDKHALEPLDSHNSQESEQLLGRVLAGKCFGMCQRNRVVGGFTTGVSFKRCHEYEQIAWHGKRDKSRYRSRISRKKARLPS